VSFIAKHFANQFSFYTVLNATTEDLAILHFLEYEVHFVIRVAISMAASQFEFIHE
jgi:hypothetical protein